MATLTPGYDFGVNEVPTRDKFLRMARGLTLGDLSEEVIAADFLTVLKGSDTASSGGSPDRVGQLWVAPGGEIWLRGNRGNLQLWRANGGWETNRFNFDNTGSLGNGAPGFGGTFDSAGDTMPDPRVSPEPTRYDTGAGIHIGLQLESGFSGAVRFLGRGVGPFGLESNKSFSSAAFYVNTILFRLDGPSPSDFWDANRADLDSDRVYVGLPLGLHPETSAVSLAGSSDEIKVVCMGYFWGARMRGPGSSI